MTSMLLQDLAQSLLVSPDESEERYIISGVSWQQYESVVAALADSPWYRVTFLEGVLEILLPNRRHESQKGQYCAVAGYLF